MKKYLVLFVLLFVPVYIYSSSFENARIDANNFYTLFKSAEKYFNIDDCEYGYDDKMFFDDDFTTGGFLNYQEFLITTLGKHASFSYLFDGVKFWTLSDGNYGKQIVSDNPTDSFVSEITDSHTKVCEYVNSDVVVIGSGTKDDPFVFISTSN